MTHNLDIIMTFYRHTLDFFFYLMIMTALVLTFVNKYWFEYAETNENRQLRHSETFLVTKIAVFSLQKSYCAAFRRLIWTTFMLILSFLEHNSHGHHPLSLHGKKNSFNIIQNIFFCVQQKKVSHTGSEWHKNEQMMTTVIQVNYFTF